MTEEDDLTDTHIIGFALRAGKLRCLLKQYMPDLLPGYEHIKNVGEERGRTLDSIRIEDFTSNSHVSDIMAFKTVYGAGVIRGYLERNYPARLRLFDHTYLEASTTDNRSVQ